jgi:hypothetical protein
MPKIRPMAHVVSVNRPSTLLRVALTLNCVSNILPESQRISLLGLCGAEAATLS